MYLILLVLNDPDRLEDLLIAWEENGVQGAIVLFSTGWGRILFKRDNFDGAREAFEQSLTLNLNSVFALHFLAVCYENLGNPVRAHEIRTRAISLTGGEFPLSG